MRQSKGDGNCAKVSGGERWTCWLDLSETYRRGRNCGETGSWRPPDEAGQSHMTSVPQTPDGKHIAVAKLVGAGFKPALVPQARCERIAVISCAIEVRTAKLGSTSHTVNAERGRVCGAPQNTHPRFLGLAVPPLQEPPAQCRFAALVWGTACSYAIALAGTGGSEPE